MLDTAGVYKIESPSGKCYVGMTADSFAARKTNHLKELRGGRHKCAGLQHAFNKYGEENLLFTVLEMISRDTEDSFFFTREQYWWDTFTSTGVKLYNGRPTGTGGVHHTPETKAKISATLKRNALEPLEKICLGCSRTFHVPPGRKYRKYCSNSCVKIGLRRFDPIEAKDLYLSGLSLRQVAKHVGVSHISVRDSLLALGVNMRKA